MPKPPAEEKPQTLIYTTGPEDAAVEIQVTEAFDCPWHLIVRRPGLPWQTARCVVKLHRTPSGEPHLEIVWLGPRAAPAIQAILERAMSARIEDVLPDGWDLVPLPGGTD